MDTKLLTNGAATGAQTTTQNPQSATGANASGGQQGSTNNPQIAAKPSSSAAKASAVQPGTTSSLLNNVGGVPLVAGPLTTVKVGKTTTTTTATTTPAAKPHEANAIAIIFVIVLVLIAIGSFVAINRSAKNTT